MRKAFTLVEIAAVLVVISLVCGIAMFSLGYIVPKRVESAARKIVSELVRLRELAAAGQEDITGAEFDYDSTLRRYVIRPIEGGVQKRDVILDAGIKITQPTNPFRVYFYSLHNERRGVADDDNDPVNGLGNTEIQINKNPKVEVIGETGFIRYIK